MKRRQSYISLFGLIVLASFTACQKTPTEVVENQESVKVAEQETLTGDINDEELNEQVPEHLSWSYGSDILKVTIDGPVTMPQTEITAGTLKPKAVSTELLQEIVNPGMTWTQDENAYYVMKPEAERQEDVADFSALLYTEPPNLNAFDYAVVGYTPEFSADSVEIYEADWNDMHKATVQSCAEQTQDILQQLGINMVIENQQLWSGNNSLYSRIGLKLSIDQIPCCNLDGFVAGEEMLIMGNITMNETSINSFSVLSNYEAAEQAPAVLLGWETVIDTLAKAIDEGAVRFTEQEMSVTSVAMEYFVRADLSYGPVWVFYGEINKGTGLIKPLIVIDASNGKILHTM